MPKPRHRPTPLLQTRAPNEAPRFSLSEYEITTEPIEGPRYKRLASEVKPAFERLHDLAQTKPWQAIPELLHWHKRYPQLPLLSNYLSIAYSQAGAYEQARHTILDNYQRHPDYLFARLNYAEICLASENTQQVAEIFGHKFALKRNRTAGVCEIVVGAVW